MSQAGLSGLRVEEEIKVKEEISESKNLNKLN